MRLLQLLRHRRHCSVGGGHLQEGAAALVDLDGVHALEVRREVDGVPCRTRVSAVSIARAI
jgi:hypothetical protein